MQLLRGNRRGETSPGICIKFVALFLKAWPDGTCSKSYDAEECRLCQTPKRVFLRCECTCRGGVAKRRVKKVRSRWEGPYPRRRGAEEDGEMWKRSSGSGDSVEAPEWHCLPGTVRGHPTFNLLEGIIHHVMMNNAKEVTRENTT